MSIGVLARKVGLGTLPSVEFGGSKRIELPKVLNQEPEDRMLQYRCILRELDEFDMYNLKSFIQTT